MTSPDLDSLDALLRDLAGSDDRPLVVFSALWPLARAMRLSGGAATDGVLDILRRIAGDQRMLAMPAFATGYRNGLCDLDAEPSTTGILTETFRRSPGVRRTVSAFFSFAVQGPGASKVVALRPRQAWGADSLYEWFERDDVLFLMLGCHPTHCSYLHRLEFLLADKIRYRYFKTLGGRMRHEGREFAMAEELFVRVLSPEAINDLTVLQPLLVAGGMRIESFGGAPISAMTARAMRDACLPSMSRDPLMVVKNRQDYEA